MSFNVTHVWQILFQTDICTYIHLHWYILVYIYAHDLMLYDNVLNNIIFCVNYIVSTL